MAKTTLETYEQGTGRLLKTEEIEAPPYQLIRRGNFQELDGDGFDAMRKAIIKIAEESNVELPQEFNEYVDKIEQIKTDIPKTED